MPSGWCCCNPAPHQSRTPRLGPRRGADADQLLVLGGDPAQCRSGILCRDPLGQLRKDRGRAGIVDHRDVLRGDHGLVDEEGHRHQQHAARHPEEEAQTLIQPAKRRPLHQPGKHRREQRGHHQHQRKDRRKGRDDRQLAAVGQEFADHRHFLDQRLHLRCEHHRQHRRHDPARDGQRFAHQPPRIGQQRRQHDDERNHPVDDSETFHGSLRPLPCACRGLSRLRTLHPRPWRDRPFRSASSRPRQQAFHPAAGSPWRNQVFAPLSTDFRSGPPGAARPTG